jgi:hypothetical protein
LSPKEVRLCIQAGELTAYRNPDPNGGRGWVVEMPEEGWTSSLMAAERDRPFIPWWWADAQRTGHVHYVQDLYASSFEEMVPRFLCGFESDNIWTVTDLSRDIICPECLEAAEGQGIEVPD